MQQEEWLMQSQGIKSDWRAENEWRYKGDVQLSSLPPDSLCCFCHTGEMEERIDRALLAVNIKPPEIEGKYPFELSGGQMQRMLWRVFLFCGRRCLWPTSRPAWLTHAYGRIFSTT